MFITKESINFESDHRLKLMQKFVVCTQSSRGYQTEQTMRFWIHNVLSPYCDDVHKELNDPTTRIWIILDNCPCHNTPAIASELEKISAEVLWLPPHSTHFLQQLDASYFGLMKLNYRAGTTVATRPKVAGKALRAYRAIWCTNIPINILRCWEITGFKYHNLWKPDMHVSLNAALIPVLLKQNCVDYDDTDARLWKI